MAKAAKKVSAKKPAKTAVKEELPKGVTQKDLEKLAKLADDLYNTRKRRYELQKEAKDLEEEEKEIKRVLIAMLPKFKSKGISGSVARVSLESKRFVRVDDWKKLQDYILKKKDFSLLQRRVADAAIEERWTAGLVIPGVVPDTLTRVGIHKL